MRILALTFMLLCLPYLNYATTTPAVPRALGISIKMLNGQETPLFVDILEQVYVIKLMIYGKEGIPADQQNLILNGQVLENSKTLFDYGVKQGNLLILKSL